MNAYILTAKCNIIINDETIIRKENDLIGIYATKRSAQKSLAEELFRDMENHPWDRAACNASKPFEEYDFYEMKDMFDDDPDFNFDATSASLKYDENEFISYTIEERQVFGLPKKSKWNFRYDEEIFDNKGANFAGVLTDGKNFLFWHAYKDREDDAIEKCHIYNSIRMHESTEECVYDWIAENDKLVTTALNCCTDANRITGENSILHGIKFYSWRDECLEPYQWKLLKAIQDKDIYEVKNGEVHILGYIYDTHDDFIKPFRSVKCSGAYLPLEERTEPAALDSALEECKEYYAEMTPMEAHAEFCGYDDGTHPIPLPIAQADKAVEGFVYIDIAPEDLPEILPF